MGSKRSLIIIGAGAHGRIVAETIELCGQFRLLGFADDRPELKDHLVGGVPIMGTWRELEADLWFVAVGKCDVRRGIWNELGAMGRQVLPPLIHPRAFVSAAARVGNGTVVLAGAVVQAGATVGEDVIVNSGAVIDHDARIGAHAHLGPNSTVESFGVVLEQEWIRAGQVVERRG